MQEELIDQRDKKDAVILAETYVPMARCPGGRLTHEGRLCVHCGRDPGEGKCSRGKRNWPRKM